MKIISIEPLGTTVTKYEIYVKYLLHRDDGGIPCHIHFNIMDKDKIFNNCEETLKNLQLSLDNKISNIDNVKQEIMKNYEK